MSEKRSPYRVDTYCGCCHHTRAHYLRDEHGDEKRDCYECAQCLHLVFAPKHQGVGLRWYENPKRKTFIVIMGQIVGNPRSGYTTVWSSDLEEKRTLKSAISHGFKTRGSDDFRIGHKRGDKLVAVSWMDQKEFDVEEVADTAEQLGLKS